LGLYFDSCIAFYLPDAYIIMELSLFCLASIGLKIWLCIGAQPIYEAGSTISLKALLLLKISRIENFYEGHFKDW